MLVKKEELVKAINEAVSKSKDRKFTETVEMAVNLRNVDMKKPENRIDTLVTLPHGVGKPRKVGVFARGETILKARDAKADLVLSPEDIDALSKDKRRARKVVNSVDFFIAEAPLMPEIGKKLGAILGPRGKIPQPIPPLSDPKPIIDRLRNSVKIRTRDKMTFHVPIGIKTMKPELLADNALEVLKVVENKYENPPLVLKSVFVKTTMGPAVRVV
ncbi:MAG: 50S ribosomal protein L1 [Archaeoglobales archaeon]|jgi:large subunit ribosomal protein L1|nr:50S ribosomal protein L1 [Archaeoglobales archaeon]TDA29862.1 MAG: 50S ribosomal protein L1 [Archaeoglobi archaeon]